ncbi:MAG: class I SAM-dependent methyltransferase [Chloroflexi bacterium]|nr:class I SAM-dependent methyltransferase [Chloroflexota bacterium]
MSDLSSIRQEQAVWAADDSLGFYRSHRNQPGDLYESERFFLPDVLTQVKSVLDVGCAAGGFSRIMRAFNPTLRYVGVDIIPEFIELARTDYPDSDFHVSDGITFPFSPGSFDLVHCSGLLHLNSHYQEMVRAMWDQTSRYLLCDFRLTREHSVTGEIDVEFGGGKSGKSLPYQVINVDELLLFLQSLVPAPASIRARGYNHSVSRSARVLLNSVIMAFFLLERSSTAETRVELALGD